MGGHSPLARRGVQRVVVIGERPRQVAMEDVARGQSQCIVQVDGCLRLDTRTAVRVGHHDVLDGLGEDGVE